jgi:hypothetical protein
MNYLELAKLVSERLTKGEEGGNTTRSEVRTKGEDAEKALQEEDKKEGPKKRGKGEKAGIDDVDGGYAHPFLRCPEEKGSLAKASLLAMPLDEFQARGALLKLRVPWLSVTLWIVPTARDVATLMAEGVNRGCIWTAAELMDLMAIVPRSQDCVHTIIRVKLAMDGEVTEAREERRR